ncbi:uncharacterized protein LOC114762971 [Neltuma alba]|uniref:uncharacterized protein LOC114762971 n=1 Tax=Neltuma alba TaxID=207710 RepID=UPI0010A5399C|nr:uncharacterized protein LOC114762971 [Prosopis alba]
MGNCLITRNNQISAQDDDDLHDEQPGDSLEVEQKTISSGSSFDQSDPAAMPPEESSMKKKKKIGKKVRFELQKDEETRKDQICRRSGSVRIKLVVTQEELKRILRHEKESQHTTLEQLLSSVKLSGRGRTCQVIAEDDGGAINAWRPTLESIPEDQL